MYFCDNFVIGFFSMSSIMLRVAEEAAEAEEAAQAEEAEDIVMSVCYTIYRWMALSCFRIHNQDYTSKIVILIINIKLN